ncbi:MAG: hypothetical protein ACKOOD_01755 [Microbacteriaceae bacterium]
MKRLLYLALALIGLVAALAAQPWFEVKLNSGNSLQVAGLDAYPNFGPTLLMDALAIALVLYLHRRWGVVFLFASLLATILGALSQIPALFNGDLALLGPTVEKATGVATWIAQLEQVVVGHQSTFYGYGTWLLLGALVLVQTLAIIDALKKGRAAIAKRRAKSPKGPSNPNDGARELWRETNPDNQ